MKRTALKRMSKKPFKYKDDCLYCKELRQRPIYGTSKASVEYHPGIQLPGTPTIKGHRLGAAAMSRCVLANGFDDTLEDFILTREELLVACWWAGLWGPRKFRKLWGKWAELAGNHLWHSCINIPNPPGEAAT